MGILPPLDALFPWLAEQTLVLVLGGSPLATDLRLVNISWDVDQSVIAGAVLEGGCRGCAPPPLEVKPSSYSLLKFVHLTSQWSHSLEVHPLLRKILHPPLHRHAKSVKSPVMHEFFCIPFSCSLIVLCSWQADQHYFNIYPLNFTTPYLQWVSHLQ